MKVLHFISAFAPGGAEIFVRNLAIKLKEYGVDQAVYSLDEIHGSRTEELRALGFQTDYKEILKLNGIEFGFIGGAARRRPSKGIRAIYSIIQRQQPDVIHCHVSGIAVYLAILNTKTPIIFTHHSTPVRRKKVHKYLLSKRVSKYIAISDAGRSALIDVGISAERIVKIHNGIPLQDFSIPREIKEDVKVILAVGRLEKPKNYPLLLRAYRKVLDLCEKSVLQKPSLWISGDGELRKSLQELCCSLEIQEHVTFLGIREDVPLLLRESDVFVMSSEREGLSIALIEALASGIPIAATNVGGNCEIIDDGVTGFLTRPDDPEDLSDKLFKLIESRRLRQLFSRNSFEKSVLFSIEKSATEHLNLYKELLH